MSPAYVPGYVTPFVCPACPHPHHGDTACKADADGGRCGCDG